MFTADLTLASKSKLESNWVGIIVVLYSSFTKSILLDNFSSAILVIFSKASWPS